MRGLCTNCLHYGEIFECPVGDELGSQRDPYRASILLCAPCKLALIDGRLAEFHDRYTTDRTVFRDELEQKKKDDGRVT